MFVKRTTARFINNSNFELKKLMPLKIYTLFFLILFSTQVSSQSTITGRISNLKTGLPIEGVDVSVVNYNIGTTSYTDGSYKLKNIPASATEILLSHISYKPIIVKLIEVNNGKLDVILEPEEISLHEVTIVAKKDKSRKKQLKKFKKAFFGSTFNSSKCEILNPEVLIFTEDANGILFVKPQVLLEIENNSTGYLIYFLLEHFKLDGELVSYAGKPAFTPLKAKNITDSLKWKSNREKTYYGSKMHFFYALFTNKLFEEGFEISKSRLSSNVFYEVKKLRAKDIVIQNLNETHVNWTGFLRVEFRLESDPFYKEASNITSNINLGQPSEKDMIQQGSTPTGSVANNQVSYLFLKKHNLKVNSIDQIIHSNNIVEYGYWTNERVADILPFDYKKIEIIAQNYTKEMIELNGFDVSNSIIPIDKIEQGGPGKDGIPALINPKFVSAKEAEYLKNDDFVLALVIDSISKAYPIKILNWHEVVNDRITDQPYLVTYCPLCGSGIIFSSEIKGKDLSFGVSGLLYNNDVILYDRETESLWSQIEMKAISGKAINQKLIPIAFIKDTWGNWKKNHPETLVLSNQTGYDRDYNRNPYDDYGKTDQLMFEVNNSNPVLSNKEMVLGVLVNGIAKAYPYSVFKNNEGIKTDNIGGKEIQIEYRNDMLYILTPGVTAITLYWFAWYAFYPETVIYKVN
jgi:hypothetical protein